MNTMSTADFSRWKGIYETWKRRRQSYAVQIETARHRGRHAFAAGLLTMSANPLGSLDRYSRFVAELLDRRDVLHSTLKIWSDSPYTGIAEGEVVFKQGVRLRMREEIDFDVARITSYGYEV